MIDFVFKRTNEKKIFAITNVENNINLLLNTKLGFKINAVKKKFLYNGTNKCAVLQFLSQKNNIKTKIDKKVLIHRGPDNFKKINYKNTTFAHWRLSIVDHSKKSNQPLNNNQYIFVYNGEIYDFKNLSEKFDKKENSDTNFLFKTLIKKKKNLNEITNYSGFYSYAYMDKIKKKITFSRDILGKKAFILLFR